MNSNSDVNVSKPVVNSTSNVFNNFEFLNVSNSTIERKNDDVEVLDID